MAKHAIRVAARVKVRAALKLFGERYLPTMFDPAAAALGWANMTKHAIQPAARVKVWASLRLFWRKTARVKVSGST